MRKREGERGEGGRERGKRIEGEGGVFHLLLRGAFFISSLACCYGIVKFPPCIHVHCT